MPDAHGSGEKLQRAAQAVSTAIAVLKIEEPTIKAFLKECRNMENFGHVVDPSLYNNSQRRVISALMEPLFKAALDFIIAHDAHVAQAKVALDKVSS